MLRNPFLETILLQKLDRTGELQPPQSLQQGLPAVNPVQEEHHRILLELQPLSVTGEAIWSYVLGIIYRN